MEQKIKFLQKTVAIICVLPLLCAWVEPVDLNADNTSGSGNNALILNINGDDASFDRCDTENAIYTDNALPIPSTCHRWNLVWDAVTTGAVGSEVLTPQTDWAPTFLGDEWRLPTIKELTRLINFGEKSYNTLHYNFSSTDKKLYKDKKLNTHVWYEKKKLNWIKASFEKKGEWQYK